MLVDLRPPFEATLLLLMLFTAMLPILWMELTALGMHVVLVVLLFEEESRSLLLSGWEVAWEMLSGKVTQDPLPTTPVVSSVPSSPECLCNQAFFSLCPG